MKNFTLLFVLMFLFTIKGQSQSDDDLLGRWSFEEGSGTTTADLSGQGHNGTLMGTVQFSNDAVVGDYSLGINRSNGEYVDVGNLNLGGQFTVSLWAKIIPGATNIQCLFASAKSGDGGNGIVIQINEYPTTDKSIRVFTGDGTNDDKASSNTGVFEYDRWNHVAVVFDKPTGRARIYLNGEDVSSDNVTLTNYPTSGHFVIGAFENASWAPNGFIDDVRIYNKKLAPSQIEEIYNAVDLPVTYTLTTSIEGEGSVIPSSGTYNENEQVKIYASPNNGWRFVSWSGDTISTNDTIIMTMDSDKNVLATFERTKKLPVDTVAKINFTFTGAYDEEGWTNVYDHESFPVTLGNGIIIRIDTEQHTIGSGFKGEPLTIFPFNVGSTYNYMHSAFQYNLHYTFTGLNPEKLYSFEVFASRNDTIDGIPVTEDRTTIYSIAGTTLSEQLDALGNTDRTVTLSDVHPTADSSIVFTVSNILGSSSCISALIVTRQVDEDEIVEVSAISVGRGLVTPDSASYLVGKEVVFTATPEDGWEFNQWAGDVSGTDPTLKVTLTSNLFVAAIFKEIADDDVETVAKLNFTYDTNYEEEGWYNIGEDYALPAQLDNGITITYDYENHTIGGGVTGEPITLYPFKVGSTYKHMHAFSEPYMLHYKFGGLDENYSYTFTAFSSRAEATVPAPGPRTAIFGIEGTDLAVELEAVGNRDKTAKLEDIKAVNNEITFTMTHKPNMYAYINALIVTRKLTTSIDRSKMANQINYYPSPVSDQLNISGLPLKSKITVFDINGKKVLSLNGVGNMHIDVQQLKKGIYLFLIEKDSFVLKSFKIIKE